MTDQRLHDLLHETVSDVTVPDLTDTARLDAVTVKTFLAFGMLLNTNAALELADVDERWARQARTRIRPGLFTHITRETNR